MVMRNFNVNDKAYGILFVDQTDSDEEHPFEWNEKAIKELCLFMGYSKEDSKEIAGEVTQYTEPGDEDEMRGYRLQENNDNLEPLDLTVEMFIKSIKDGFGE